MSTIFTTSIQNKLWTEPLDTLEDMVCMLRDMADALECMSEDGIKLDPRNNVEDEYLGLVTNNPSVAGKYFMEPDEEEDEEDELQEELSIDLDADFEELDILTSDNELGNLILREEFSVDLEDLEDGDELLNMINRS